MIFILYICGIIIKVMKNLLVNIVGLVFFYICAKWIKNIFLLWEFFDVFIKQKKKKKTPNSNKDRGFLFYTYFDILVALGQWQMRSLRRTENP